jgi:pSer/pThr/pTyr-binding forkhead associated (FHA) protein
MSRKVEHDLDPSQPALIVTYGNTTRKHRPLDGEVLVIGQSRVCDMGLASPEVAPVHCLVIRGASGWRLRDCGSRGGTRVNGKAVQEAELRDGDAIQIGPFSFQAHLPDRPPPAAIPLGTVKDSALPRLQRSRRNLARIALRIRRRLQAERVVARQNLSPQPENLREKQRDFAARATRLEEAERELAAARARHEQDVAAFQKQTADREKQMADEEKLLETSGSALALANELEAQRLNEWRAQLEQYAAQLEQSRQQLIAEETRLAEVRDKVAREQRDLQERQVAQRQMMSQAEAGLRDQREALTRLMGELKRLHQEVRARDEATVQLLRRQNEELRASLAHGEAPAARKVPVPKATTASGRHEPAKSDSATARLAPAARP